MASLQQAARHAGELEQLAKQLKGELRNGEADFEQVASLAEELSTKAARMAETFSGINDVLAGHGKT